MAIKKLNSNDYVMWVDDTTPITSPSGAAYDLVACISSAGLSGTRAVIEVNDRCGNDALPGNATNTFTGTGNAIDEALEPSAVSYEKLLALYQSGTSFWMKLANGGSQSDPNATVVVREGIGFITDYAETADQDTPYVFTFTFRISGDILTGQAT